MSAKLFVFIGCMAILSVASAHVVRRDAPNTELTFADFWETAGKNLKEVENVLLKAFGVDNTEQLETKAKEQGKEYAQQLDVWAKNLIQETEGMKDLPIFKSIRESANQVIENVQSKHPQTVADLKSFTDKTTKSTEEIFNKLKEVSESEDAKNVKELSGKLLDTAASTFQNLAKQFGENIKA